MRRLIVKVWLALVAAVLVSLCGGAATVRLTVHDGERLAGPVRALAHDLVYDAPGDAALLARAHARGIDVSLYNSDGEARGSTSHLPLPPPRKSGEHWVRGRGGAGLAIPQQDGSWLVVGHSHPPAAAVVHLAMLVLAVVFALLAAAAWPLARHLTGRLERLRLAVDELGRGALAARVEVSGRDEVAELARSFNRSAERIEALVEGQRRVLASTSHELRSPLARLRLALEMLDGADEARRAALVGEATRDIEELDTLIGDILLASRLDAGAATTPLAPVELGVLARQEAEPFGARVEGQATVDGDERMLRRLLRNLLENASRHGAPPITVEVRADGLVVTDAGPGIPVEERERVFAPFYRPESGVEGVGLGLSLVARIARHHGWSARVADTARGARIEVRGPTGS